MIGIRIIRISTKIRRQLKQLVEKFLVTLIFNYYDYGDWELKIGYKGKERDRVTPLSCAG